MSIVVLDVITIDCHQASLSANSILWPQNKEDSNSTSSDTNVTKLTVLSEAEAYLFRGRGVFIDVYKAEHKIATSGTTSLADIDLRRTYRAIDTVATGRIPSLFCAMTL